MQAQVQRPQRPIVGVALAFAGGVAAGRGWGVGAAAVFVVAMLAVALGPAVLGRGARWSGAFRRGGVLWLAVAAAATLYTAARVGHASTTLLPWVGQEVDVAGSVAGEPDVWEGRSSYVVAVERVNGSAASGRVRLVDYRKGARPLLSGDRIAAAVRLRRPRAAANPGEFDAASHLARQGIHFEATLAPGARIERIGTGARGVMSLAASLRRMLEAALRRALSDEPAALAAGLLFGSRAALDDALVADFRAAGILHLLAVSGSNVAFVALPTLAALRRFGTGRDGALLGTAATVAVFVLVTGAGPSVVRAGAMACAALLATLAGRRADALAALAAAGLLQMLWQPLVLFDAGFQLSFAATAGLLAFAKRGTERLSALAARVGGWKGGAIGAVGSAAVVTAAAQAGVLPVQAHYFGSVSLAAVPANIVALPIVAALVPVAGVLCLLALSVPALAAPFAATVELLVAALTWTAAVCARLPFAEIAVPPLGRVALAAYVCAGLYFAGWWTPPGVVPARAWKARHYAIAALAVAVGLTWTAALRPRDRLEVIFLARRGDVAFVRFPDGTTALLDWRARDGAGDDGDPGAPRDQAADRLAPGDPDEPWLGSLQPFLRRQGVFRPDHVWRPADGPRALPWPTAAAPSPSDAGVRRPRGSVGLRVLGPVDASAGEDPPPVAVEHGDVTIVFGGHVGDSDAVLAALGGRAVDLTVWRPASGAHRRGGDAASFERAAPDGAAFAGGMRVIHPDLERAVTVRSNGRGIMMSGMDTAHPAPREEATGR